MTTSRFEGDEPRETASEAILARLYPRQKQAIEATRRTVSAWVREAVEEKLRRDVPGYGE